MIAILRAKIKNMAVSSLELAILSNTHFHRKVSNGKTGLPFQTSRCSRIFSSGPNQRVGLRTVPTIVIAHTFCASRDTRISYGWCLLLQGYFCAVQNYADKVEHSKCPWYPKRKSGVATHFSEIIKLQFGKEHHKLLCILKLFTNIVD